MIKKIENLLATDIRWKEYSGLYNHVKSAIHYAAGLRGEFESRVNYNIEELVNTLNELERNELHPLYPFIASWNPRFVSLASSGFVKVVRFRDMILAELQKWMCPEDTAKGEYFYGLARLQEDLNFPLPVFSLNYDLCIERLKDRNVVIETGFGGWGPGQYWNWERFDGADQLDSQIVLYKLHGSINWKREKLTKQLFSVEQVQAVDAQEMEVIFGRDFKLEAADPYLFYTYQFRQYTLMASLIVVVGYGFNDTHINQILSQRIRADEECCLLVVCDCTESDVESERERVSRRLELGNSSSARVSVHPGSAKQFFEIRDLYSVLVDSIPGMDDVPF